MGAVKDLPEVVFPAACPQCSRRVLPVDAMRPMAWMIECRHCGCRAYAASWVAHAWSSIRSGA